MAIRPSDVKRLWGRAGGRCSVCRSEVRAEIAHIVARSPDGPRGEDQLPIGQRDLYENLMLLCPNDHSSIDGDTKKWTVARLRDIKVEHELWVQRRLEQGTIRPFEAGASDFAENRLMAWQIMKDHAWLFLSLTPLEVREEVLDPIHEPIQDLLSSLPTPRKYHEVLETTLNSNNTEPSAKGLLNENFRQISNGLGFRVEIFRNGHVEYVYCIDKFLSSKEQFGYGGGNSHRLTECSRFIEYQYLAELLLDQIQQLQNLWTNVPLPAADMLLTAGLLNCRGACLLAFSYTEHRPFIGRCIEDSVLAHETIVERKWPLQEVYNIMLSRLVNMMGLHPSEPWTGGKIPMPRHL
jgi:hypothetical protein